MWSWNRDGLAMRRLVNHFEWIFFYDVPCVGLICINLTDVGLVSVAQPVCAVRRFVTRD